MILKLWIIEQLQTLHLPARTASIFAALFWFYWLAWVFCHYFRICSCMFTVTPNCDVIRFFIVSKTSHHHSPNALVTCTNIFQSLTLIWWSWFYKPLQSNARKRLEVTTVTGSGQRAVAPATPTCTNSWSIFICSEPRGCALDSVKHCSYGYSTRPCQRQSKAALKACLWNWG